MLTASRAAVFLDGHLVGWTPDFRMLLPEGSYSVLIRPEQTDIRHRAEITIVDRETHRVELGNR